MGGLRALCCSSADKNDPDDHPSPNRPLHQSQNGQNAPTGVNQGSYLTDVTQGKPEEKPKEEPVEKPVGKPKEKPPPPRNLWKEAYDGLDRSSQDLLPENGKPATDAIQGVIDITTAKYKEFQKGGLRIHRKEKDDINIRDASMKILGAAMKAKDVISTAVSFDPTGHASSAWTVISFGMSIVQNRLDRRDAIFQSSAYLTENLSWFAIVDAHYRNQEVDTDKHVDEALLRAYSAILQFTAEVKKSEKENEAVRTWKSIFPLTDQALSTLKVAVAEEKAAADQWIGLAANLGDRERAKEHLAKTDASLEATRRLEDKAKTVEEENQVKWMSEFNFSGRQNFLQKKRTGDTGIWLLDSQEYTDWMVTPGDLLWLPGISGCGKSVLCSTVIHDLGEICELDPYKYLAYWYFHFGDDLTKSVYSMARSLIRQLSRSPLPSSLVKLWDKHHLQGSEPNLQTILGVLDDVLSSIPDQGHVYLVFDALDECPANTTADSERKSLLSVIVDLLERHKDKVHILATSRPETDIKEELEKFSTVDLEAHLAEDVKQFVTAAISRDPLQKYSEEIKALIFHTLVNSEERRFRWVELQIQTLEKRRKRRTGDDEDIKEALKKIPKDLEDTYRRILNSIDPDDIPLARDILMLICLSPATLEVNTVAEMANLDNPDDVVNICTTSLLSLSDEKIQLAHFSVQEFLIVSEEVGHHECQFSAANGHRSLLTATVDYLLEQTKELTPEEATERPFFLYASKNWSTHATASGDIDRLDPGLKSKITHLFTQPTVYLNWVRIASNFGTRGERWSTTPESCELPIHRASWMGFLEAVEELLNQGADPEANTQEGRYGSALQGASFHGHEKIVQVLLDRGVNFNGPGGKYGTALQSASFQKHEKIVKMLLDRGADITIPGGVYGNALQAASLGGNESIVQILLDTGADVNAEQGGYGSPIQGASLNGNENVVQMLLDQHADVNAIGREGSALQAAATGGHEKIVWMLLDQHADVNTLGGTYGSPLQAAAYGGYENIVRTLLDRHADVNAPDGEYGSALQAAASGGTGKIVQMLLDKGADPDAEGPLGTALLAAAMGGRKDCVEVLLDHGVDINARGGLEENCTPLQFAARDGPEEVVQLLLERGADPNILEGDIGSALQAAVMDDTENGRIVQMLLDGGANVNAIGGKYGTPLQAAAYFGNKKAINLMLDRGADINAQGTATPLQEAAAEFDAEIVQLLLDRGADVNATGGEYGTALEAASSPGKEKIVQMLLDRGATMST